MLQKTYRIGLVMALLAVSPLLAADKKWISAEGKQRKQVVIIHPKVLDVRIPPFSVIKREIEKAKNPIISFFRNNDYNYIHRFIWSGVVAKITFIAELI